MPRKKSLLGMSPILAVFTTILMLPLAGWGASKYKVLYSFTGGADGGTPNGLIIDQLGNLYGTTSAGGATGNGTVFKLEPLPGGTWKETVLHSFSGPDGATPAAALVFDASGNLYGTTWQGGPQCMFFSNGCGVVFKLRPRSDGTWTESVLYKFKGGASDGAAPFGSLILDKAGNLYGTVEALGSGGAGDVYRLKRNANGTWTENIVYMFTGNGPDGVSPTSSLVFDGAGNLYGTTFEGGNMNCPDGAYGCGVAFKLTPNADGSCSESLPYTFCPTATCVDGAYPNAALIFDKAGNLYGTTQLGGIPSSNGRVNGTVFSLSESAGSWTENVVYAFDGLHGSQPVAPLVFDGVGNLYGTTSYGGSSADGGVVFKLSPSLGGTWAYTVLHVFGGNPALHPRAGLVLDGAAHLYGTTSSCASGAKCMGVVFEITP
jgi:uncharacterized repeat protein (TIGR03803 family)